MNALIVVIALAAAEGKPDPLRLACPGFTGPNLKSEELTYFSDFFANQLRLQGIKVTTPSEIAAVLGLERQKALLGCTSADCTSADLSLQLGVDGIVQGSLGRFGKGGMQIDLKVLLATTGETIAARSVTAQNDSELYELLRRSAQEVAIELFHKLSKMPTPQVIVELAAPPQSSSYSPVPGYVAVGLGVAAAGGGAALLFVGRDQLASVRGGSPDTYQQALSKADSAKTLSTVGVVLIGAGAAVLVGGIAYAVVVSRSDSALALAPYLGPGEGGLVLSGRFP